MTQDERPTDDEAAVSLTQAEQDELNNRVLSGEAAQESSTDDVELARLGSYVLLEVDDDQHIEKHADEKAAEQRYDELKARHVEPDGDREPDPGEA